MVQILRTSSNIFHLAQDYFSDFFSLFVDMADNIYMMMAEKERKKMLKIGDRVQVGRQINRSRLVDMADAVSGTVVDIIPGYREGEYVYRETMYRIRFDSTCKDIVTLTPTPNESWIDEVRVVAFPE